MFNIQRKEGDKPDIKVQKNSFLILIGTEIFSLTQSYGMLRGTSRALVQFLHGKLNGNVHIPALPLLNV